MKVDFMTALILVDIQNDLRSDEPTCRLKPST
jgi:nicotinamidase-related amidase